VLQALGRYGEALAVYQAVEPVYSEALGAHHNFVLFARRLHAIYLANLERWNEALKAIESVYAIEQETLGLSHMQTVSTRSAQIGIEIAVKRNGDQADELREIIGTLSPVTGPGNSWTLFARYRLSRLLFQRGRMDEAQAEIVDTIAQFDQMTDPGHCLLRSATGLLDAIEGRPTSEKLTV
jgi:tetratricopeptide (TPR) repeat protein